MKRASLFFLFASCTLSLGAGEPVSIFDGKTLNGWDADAKLWHVEHGEIRGGSLTEQVTHNDFVATTKSYQNFDLRVKLRLTGTGFVNSGVQIRSLRVPNSPEMSGYQVDYGAGWYGKLYDESRRNKVVGQAADVKAAEAAIHPDEWNEYRIRAVGPRIQSWINGVPALDYTEADPNVPQDGFIGIQIHGGGKAQVQVKDVFIEELPPTPNAPTWEKLGGVEAVKKSLAPAKPQAGAAKTTGRDISYNVSNAVPQTPEQEQKLLHAPEGFEIELVAAESEGIGKFVTVDWDQKGRMWSMTALEYPVDGNENMERARALYASHARDKVLVFDHPEAPGPHQPRVFADGLALPLGILPYKNGCYAHHGSDIVYLEDTDGDGRADKTTKILSDFGIQDSHLMPHQFTRMPGDWIWMAQGAFNKGNVKTTAGTEVQFDSTRMGRFKPDGSQFEALCTGPCNIWGFEVMGTGEMFIQEANDYGYPVMPFHIGANYPGCADRLFKSYAPEFPGLATFRMGGTGLSGLALANKHSRFDAGPSDGEIMYVANPITRQIQAIQMLRDGPRWKLEKLPDFINSDDPMFRPVSIHFGPDGALYIVDWYNKIISHNEVPRNHPDRDKTRGRIWRVKPKGQKLESMPDMTTCAPEKLVALLGSDNIRESHLAWQAMVDRRLTELVPRLQTIASDATAAGAKRTEALWAWEGLQRPVWEDRHASSEELKIFTGLLKDHDRNVRREVVRIVSNGPAVRALDALEALDKVKDDKDPEVRAEIIRGTVGLLAQVIPQSRDIKTPMALKLLLNLAANSLNEPLGPSTRNGKPIRVAEAYEREFERYLVRSGIEDLIASSSKQHTEGLASAIEFNLQTAVGVADLPVENRLLATLALPPKTSAPLVAKFLGQLKRPPNDEEVLRLAEGLGDPTVNDALAAALNNKATQQNIASVLLRLRTKLDTDRLAPLLQSTALELLNGNETSQNLALQLAGEFQFTELETPIVAILHNAISQHQTSLITACLRALGLMGSHETVLFASLATTERDPLIRNEALGALASSKAPEAPGKVFTLWKDLDSAGRRIVLDRLVTTKGGARAVVTALKDKTLKPEEMDAGALDRLQALLGENDPDLASVMGAVSTLFRPVLRLDGNTNDYVDPGLTLDGPFTVETWVRLDPGIGNEDGILGSQGQLDMNFFGSQFRVWTGHDSIVANKKMAPDNWTHIAVTRNAQGMFQIFIDGELDQARGKSAPQKFEKVRIGWAQPKKGTQGMLAEFRIWNRVRTPEEIRNHFDRALDSKTPVEGLVYRGSGGTWSGLHGKAHVIKTSDFPPLLSPDESRELDEKFAHNRHLAQKPGGDPAKGKLIATLCMSCHLIQGQGGNIGPNISGAGTMGMEALLRRLITPNAALESAYRIYRVELKNGDLVDAFLVSDDANAIVLRQPGVPDRRIPKSDVRNARFIRRGMMPEGILDALQPEQVTDLFAYLMSLKG
jgi:putative heme-binding domain-containing protein